jgi:hypothetical protein
MDRAKPQLNRAAIGILRSYQKSLTIFDFRELELLMSGVATTDIGDSMANTRYTGLFRGPNATVCQWFWDVVGEDFEHETRARLLQFVTGTSGVPARGLGVPQGDDSNTRLLCLRGIQTEESVQPN